MSDGRSDPFTRLLEQSLMAWHLLARIEKMSNGDVVIEGLGRRILIARAQPGLPFRWLVTTDGRQRPALSIISVLRQVRGALDQSFTPVRVRIPPPSMDA